MSRTRIHMATDDVTVALCGWWMNLEITNDADAVTCKSCRRALRRAKVAARANKPRELTAAEQRQQDAEMTALRIVRPPAQFITPEVWRDACRGSVVDADMRCGRCALCEQESVIQEAARVTPNRDGGIVRDAVVQHRWSSVDAALAYWAGAASTNAFRSAFGPMMERASLGGGTSSSSPNDRPMIAAALISAVDRAVALAYAAHVDQFGLDGDRCTIVLQARSSGYDVDAVARMFGLEPAVVKAIASHGRRIVRIELAARGHIPAPRPHDPLRLEIAQRREALARAVTTRSLGMARQGGR